MSPSHLAYNDPGQYSVGQTTNDKVQAIANAGVCDRFVLMCYAAAMWDMPTIEANVGPAVSRTIAHVQDAKQVILALTPAGLDEANLAYFLSQVTSNDLGGLFVWNFPALASADLSTILETLNIS